MSDASTLSQAFWRAGGAVTSPASSYVPSEVGTSAAAELAACRSPTRRKKHKNTTYSKSDGEVWDLVDSVIISVSHSPQMNCDNLH